jgi:hypothetical protein
MSNIKLFEEKHVRSVYNEQDEKWYFLYKMLYKYLPIAMM